MENRRPAHGRDQAVPLGSLWLWRRPMPGAMIVAAPFCVANRGCVHDGRVVYDFRITQYPGGIVAAGNNGLTVVKDGTIVFDGTVATKP
jgi:hypothetical protein